jgi:putative sigma-54 modulation protein
MTILFTGRKAHLTPSLKEYAKDKLARLERLLDDVLDVHVILIQERHRHVGEIVVKAPHATFTAKAEAAEPRDALGACADRLVVQARKHRDRILKGRKRQGAKISPRHLPVGFPAPIQSAEGSPADGDGAGVIHMGRVPAKPMSLEEAVTEARGSRTPFVVFRNADSQQLAVLFRRPDGRLGLIETEA